MNLNLCFYIVHYSRKFISQQQILFMKIIYRGAESIIYLDKFDGQNVLVKERVKKNFRLEQIDEKLRKERTRKEVKLLTESRKYNVLTPKIINVDFQKHKIIMEKIAGKRIK